MALSICKLAAYPANSYDEFVCSVAHTEETSMTLRRGTVVAGTFGLVLLAGSWAATAMGRDGVVKTNSGQTFRGEVTETDTGVSVNVKGILTNINREQIAS